MKNLANPIAYRFIDACIKFPDKNAICSGNQYYTYNQLLNQVYVIYEMLNKHYHDVQIVGVLNSHNIHTYASILAISLSNKTYIPIDADNPRERNIYIKEITDMQLLLCSSQDESMQYLGIKIIDLTQLDNFILKDTEEILQSLKLKKIETSEIAYVMFTSGTTGIPKGVPVSNINVNYFLNHFIQKNGYFFTENDRFLQMFDLGFDLSIFSIFVPLSIGACIYVLPNQGLKYLALVDIMQENAITVALMVPSVITYLKLYIEELRLPELRYSLFCGEALREDICNLWSRCLSNAKIINLYGPTEVTVACTEYIWDNSMNRLQSINGIVSIGKIFEGLDYLIIDEDDKVLSVGDIGELCISGKQVIEGYLKNVEFDVFFEKSGIRYYRTGDLVALDENMNLYFYGRKDSQVKINGYRVELSEIEHCINGFYRGTVSIVLKRENRQGIAELFAFIVDLNSIMELKDYMSARLPAYMMPQQFIAISSFPLNANGKIDMQRLKSLLPPL